MAFKLTALVLDFGPRDPLSKLLLMALADRADKAGVCFPGRADLVERTGVSDSTITRRLRVLERDGWLQRAKRFQTSNLFRLNVAKLYQAQAEAARRPDVPDGFEPFAEELAAAQAIEKSDNGQADPQYGQADGHNGQADHVTSHQSTKQSSDLAVVLSESDFREYLATRQGSETRAQWAVRLGKGLVGLGSVKAGGKKG